MYRCPESVQKFIKTQEVKFKSKYEVTDPNEMLQTKELNAPTEHKDFCFDSQNYNFLILNLEYFWTALS